MRTVFRDMQRSRAGQRKIHRRASLHGGVSRKSGYTPGSVVGDHLSHSGPRCAPMPAIGVCAPAAGGECVLPAPYGAYLDLHRGGDYPCHRAVAGPLASLSLFTATGHSMRSGGARPAPPGGGGGPPPGTPEGAWGQVPPLSSTGGCHRRLTPPGLTPCANFCSLRVLQTEPKPLGLHEQRCREVPRPSRAAATYRTFA